MSQMRVSETKGASNEAPLAIEREATLKEAILHHRPTLSLTDEVWEAAKIAANRRVLKGITANNSAWRHPDLVESEEAKLLMHKDIWGEFLGPDIPFPWQDCRAKKSGAWGVYKRLFDRHAPWPEFPSREKREFLWEEFLGIDAPYQSIEGLSGPFEVHIPGGFGPLVSKGDIWKINEALGPDVTLSFRVIDEENLSLGGTLATAMNIKVENKAAFMGRADMAASSMLSVAWWIKDWVLMGMPKQQTLESFWRQGTEHELYAAAKMYRAEISKPAGLRNMTSLDPNVPEDPQTRKSLDDDDDNDATTPRVRLPPTN